MTVKTKTLSALAAAALVAVLAGCDAEVNIGSGKDSDSSAPPAAHSDPTTAAPDASARATGDAADEGTDDASCLIGTWKPTYQDAGERSMTFDRGGSLAAELEGSTKTATYVAKASWSTTPGGDLLVYDGYFEVNGQRVSNEEAADEFGYDSVWFNPTQTPFTCSEKTLSVEEATYVRQ